MWVVPVGVIIPLRVAVLLVERLVLVHVMDVLTVVMDVLVIALVVEVVVPDV